MVQSAEYIHKKLLSENLLQLAFSHDKERKTEQFPLVRTTFSSLVTCYLLCPQVCTGHSLGGGTAAILAILLREEYPDVTCYAFSPPGGLLR